LHGHPYEEVFVVQEGTATFIVGDEQIEVKGGRLTSLLRKPRNPDLRTL
jgi:mannose-6-phosphate isomerase-like protein (cupin superfamily)